MARRGLQALLGLMALTACKNASMPSNPPAITAEGKAYARNLKLSEVAMQGSESFAGGRLVEILGKIQNGGERVVKQVDIHCVFYDTYNQVVTRQRLSIVKNGLKPGEMKSFRLPFDTIPDSWNQALPQVVIAAIVFE